MICPYCSGSVEFDWREDYYPAQSPVGFADFGGYCLQTAYCPQCHKFVVRLMHGEALRRTAYGYDMSGIDEEDLIYPKYPSARRLNESVPEEYARLYLEAARVSYVSPRAGAALCRSLFRKVLHDQMYLKRTTLEEEIQMLEEATNVPSSLVEFLKLSRRAADFEAHPEKAENPGAVLEAGAGETDVWLQTLTELFDLIFVKPQKQQEFLDQMKEKYGI